MRPNLGECMHSVDFIIIILYLGGCICLGLYKSNRIKGIEEYSVGGANTPAFALIDTAREVTDRTNTPNFIIKSPQ